MADPTAPVHVATLGAALSANKGAASMLQSVLDNLPERLGPCRFAVLTTYPDDDRRRPDPPGDDVDIVSCRPVELALLHWPLAVLIAVLRSLRAPTGWLHRTPALRALRRADLVVDVAGISFVDGRGIPITVYNALMTSLPLLLGRPVVKGSQALGPFRSPVNRTLARLVLPRLAAVCARGERTERHLAELGLANVEPAADLAFTMTLPEEAVVRARARLAAARNGSDRPLVGVAPSAVVARYCRDQGVDYHELVARFVDGLVERFDLDVLLFAHSSRPAPSSGRMNDFPVIRDVHARLRHRDRCVLLDADLGPAELRALIAETEVLVTSRFHAMVSAVATSTPVLVIGWSHKYAEVLAELGLDEWVLDWHDASADDLLDRFGDLHGRAGTVRQRMTEAGPKLRARSEHNHEVMAGVVTGSFRSPGPGEPAR